MTGLEAFLEIVKVGIIIFGLGLAVEHVIYLIVKKWKEKEKAVNEEK